MRFIDLFAGLDEFHLALRRLGHECVFASEVDDDLRELYEKNFGILPEGNIRDIPNSRIPRHDILCAGFPCQPFSKAGEQNGVECPKWGDLYEDHVLRIDTDLLSRSDMACLLEAARKYGKTPFGKLKRLSRQGKAFENAGPNGEMKLADLVDELRDGEAVASHLKDRNPGEARLTAV